MESIYDTFIKVDAKTVDELAKQAGLDFTAAKVGIRYTFNPDDFVEDEEEEVEVEETPKLKPLIPKLIPKLPWQQLEDDKMVEVLVDAEEKSVGTDMDVPRHMAIIRTDSGACLGVAGQDYGILQYKDMLAFTEVLVDQGEAEYVAGGIVDNGARAFVIMKTGDHIQLNQDDSIKCFFYVTTSHDATKGLDVVLAPVRTSNGTVLTFSHRPLRFKHSKNVVNRVKNAKRSIAKIQEDWAKLPESFEKLAGVTLSTNQVGDYLDMLYPVPDADSKAAITRAENVRDEIVTLYKKAPEFPNTKGTLLGLYFAYLEYVDRRKTVRKNKHLNAADAKKVTLLTGALARSKAEAYGFAVELASQSNLTLINK